MVRVQCGGRAGSKHYCGHLKENPELIVAVGASI